MNIELSYAEINALTKVLTFIRFSCKEYDARYLAGSPIVSELHKKLTESMSDYTQTKGIVLSSDWPKIESLPHYLETIRVHMANTDNWNSLTLEQKYLFVKTLTFPYSISETTMEELIKQRDNG